MLDSFVPMESRQDTLKVEITRLLKLLLLTKGYQRYQHSSEITALKYL